MITKGETHRQKAHIYHEHLTRLFHLSGERGDLPPFCFPPKSLEMLESEIATQQQSRPRKPRGLKLAADQPSDIHRSLLETLAWQGMGACV